MAKDPAFLFYSSDFITGTILMTNEQVGIYIKLLCIQHQHGGLIDRVSFESLTNGHDLVRSKFVETPEGYYNRRLMDEMIKRSKKSDSLSANAKARWDKEKKKQCKSNAIASKKHSGLHMPIENENEDVNEDVVVDERFEYLWGLYPKKLGKKEAKRHFKASIKTGKKDEQIKKSIENYKNHLKTQKIEDKYIKHGSSFFNNWEDWLEYKPKRLSKYEQPCRRQYAVG